VLAVLNVTALMLGIKLLHNYMVKVASGDTSRGPVWLSCEFRR
jgi:hypothetical protein